MAKSHCIVDQARLHKLYEYNPETGIFTSRLYSKPVGHIHKGYLVVELWHNRCPRKFMLHQLAWLYVYGRWPHPMIDHINGTKTDNRLCNLREVTSKQNAENKQGGHSKSDLPKSGYKGVHWVKQSLKWRASIGHNGKTFNLGLFDDPKMAFLKYKEVASIFHTHNEKIK